MNKLIRNDNYCKIFGVLGKAYAMYEMKIICSVILRKYRLHTTLKKEDIKLRHSFVISSANGYNVSISERSK